ncbi:MAG: hypothetical protein HC845_05730 [Akkermansiaceae bacterium]|nr:hypothetical protein [Akkermansiaceae bacterium]
MNRHFFFSAFLTLIAAPWLHAQDVPQSVTQVAYLKSDTPTKNDYFGSVAISGEWAVVGAPFDGKKNTGAVFVYRLVDKKWGLLYRNSRLQWLAKKMTDLASRLRLIEIRSSLAHLPKMAPALWSIQERFTSTLFLLSPLRTLPGHNKRASLPVMQRLETFSVIRSVFLGKES